MKHSALLLLLIFTVAVAPVGEAQLDAPAPRIRREPVHTQPAVPAQTSTQVKPTEGGQPASQAQPPAAVRPPKPVAAPAPAARSLQAVVDPVALDNTVLLSVTELFRAGNLTEAKKGAASLVSGEEKYQDSSTVHYRCFASLMEKHLYELHQERAGAKLQKVEWVSEPISEGYYLLGLIAFQEEKPKEALEYLQKAIQWSPVRSGFHAERAYIQLRSQKTADLAMVVASYLKALELADNDSDFALALRGLGFCYIERQDMETALACYLRSLAYDPESPAAKEEINYIRSSHPDLVAGMDAKQAVQILQRSSIPDRIDPLHAVVLLRIADTLTQKDHKKQLQAVLRRAAQIDPQNADIASRLKAVED